MGSTPTWRTNEKVDTMVVDQQEQALVSLTNTLHKVMAKHGVLCAMCGGTVGLEWDEPRSMWVHGGCAADYAMAVMEDRDRHE